MADTRTAAAQADRVRASDLRLAEAVLRKDRKASAEFVGCYSGVVQAYLHRRLLPRADLVDDMVQEVFLAAWRSLDRYEGRSSLRSWLLGIARHKVEDHYRSRLREPEPLGAADEEDGRISVNPLYDEKMDRERLQKRTRQVLESLPEMYSAALLWRYWEKRTAAEMAEQTGKTPKAIERIVARARHQFRRRWKHEASA